MKFIPERFKHDGLFIQMFLITVTIIITVTVTITWTTIRMSEQFFIKKFSITNLKVINQIKDSFESLNYSVVVASNNFLQSSTVKKVLTKKESDIERMNSIYNMGQQMKNFKSNLDTYEVGIVVMANKGESFATDRTYWPISDEELRSSPLYHYTLKEPKRLLYHYNQVNDQTDPLKNRNFVVASRALMDRISGKVYGSLYFAFSEKELRKIYSNYTSSGNNIFLLDKTGVIVSSNQANLIGQKATDLLHDAKRINRQTNKYITENFMGKEQIISMEYLPFFDMYMFNTIDKKTAIGDLIDKKAMFLLSMAIAAIALFIVFLTSRRLTNSLSLLVKQIGSVSKYNFHQYVDVKGTFETRQISLAFNSMLDELHEYVDQLVQAQKQQRNAELAALQQQINPHFLYNTLASIKFMVTQNEKEDTEATINAFISLLQNTIGNVSETVTVSQELDNLKNYVFINQKRYGDQIKVNYFVTPDCIDCQIPKLILQPFIENSFFHGFNHKENGYINVLIWRESDNLICEVVDNGDGMEVLEGNKLPKTKRKQHVFSGIGVRNVHERIQLIYGDGYGITISSKLGEGTKVRILLPNNKK